MNGHVYIKKSTSYTPFVKMDYDAGIIEVEGASNPGNVLAFYEPVFKAVEEFKDSHTDKITANFSMHYFNSGSARCLFLILKELKKLQNRGRGVKINWYYEEDDHDMQETGEDFESLIEMGFYYHPLEVDEDF